METIEGRVQFTCDYVLAQTKPDFMAGLCVDAVHRETYRRLIESCYPQIEIDYEGWLDQWHSVYVFRLMRRKDAKVQGK